MLVTRSFILANRTRHVGFIISRQLKVNAKSLNCQKVEKGNEKVYSIKGRDEQCEQLKVEPPNPKQEVVLKDQKISILEKVKAMNFNEVQKKTGEKLNTLKDKSCEKLGDVKDKLNEMQVKETWALMRTQNASTNLKLLKEKIIDLLTSIQWKAVPGKVKNGAEVTLKFSKDAYVVGSHYFRMFLNSREYDLMKEQTIKLSIYVYNMSKKMFEKLKVFVKETYMEKRK